MGSLVVGVLAAPGAAGTLLIPSGRFADQVTAVDQVRLAVLVATPATIGGALVESELAVRDAAYGSHADERTEAERD